MMYSYEKYSAALFPTIITHYEIDENNSLTFFAGERVSGIYKVDWLLRQGYIVETYEMNYWVPTSLEMEIQDLNKIGYRRG